MGLHPHLRSATSAVMVIIGIALVMAGAWSVWLRADVLDTDTWVRATDAALHDDAVRHDVARWSVDELFERTDAERSLAAMLPRELRHLAGQTAARVRTDFYARAERALTEARVQAAWAAANRAAHEEFVQRVRDHGNGNDSDAVASSVRIELRPILEQVADSLEIDRELIEYVPPEALQLRLADSARIERDIRVLGVLDRWGYGFLAVGIACLVLGAALARRRGWTVLVIGAALVAAGSVIGWSRGELGERVTASTGSVPAWQDAAAITWSILSARLEDIGRVGMVAGVLIMVAAAGAIAWSASRARARTLTRE